MTTTTWVVEQRATGVILWEGEAADATEALDRAAQAAGYRDAAHAAAILGRADGTDGHDPGVVAYEAPPLRIDTEIDNGETGDARLALIVCEARDALPRCHDREMVAALDTNGGAMGICTSDDEPGGDQVAFDDACEALGCSRAELRAAVEAAYPPARDWIWADCAPACMSEDCQERAAQRVLVVPESDRASHEAAGYAGIRRPLGGLLPGESRDLCDSCAAEALESEWAAAQD